MTTRYTSYASNINLLITQRKKSMLWKLNNWLIQMISVVKIRMTRIKTKERCLTFLSLGSLFPLFTLLFFPKHENRLDMAAQTLAFPDPLTRILRWSDISPHHKSGRESYLWWAMIKHKQSPDYRSKSPHDITVCTTAFTITVYS